MLKNSGLSGPCALTYADINRNVQQGRPGNYVAGDLNEHGGITVERAGRSDHDVHGRLQDYIGVYRYFKFGYAQSAREAFEKECRLYHDFDPPDNAIHPDRPNGTNWMCPCCVIFD
ncbi:hypothetical protein GIW81_03445 [Hyphomicrobium sp. xq]|uniref:Uncharacterized protein n=1 Tax=Hyphomicrobium album TaxID=2665159 RepID=A0A6I3KGF8_9HYPH|nr:hypothetical protein [Hyphomicrobium album]MTD93389.1 hypothetical protein [Hyphomicrobium album]